MRPFRPQWTRLAPYPASGSIRLLLRLDSIKRCLQGFSTLNTLRREDQDDGTSSSQEEGPGTRSKINIDALLQSISTPKVSLGSLSSATSLGKNTQIIPPGDKPVYREDDGFGKDINLANMEQPWKTKNTAKSYILRLQNCGQTMIESDIQRLFANHEAILKGWKQEGMDILHIVPARNRILQRLNQYYIYFHSEKAANYHLEHFVTRNKDKKINWQLITLPPSAAAQTAKELEKTQFGSGRDILKGGPTSVKGWDTMLSAVDSRKMSIAGVKPSLLYQKRGAPERTVLVCLCANHRWKYLQVWLRYSLLEKHGFGRWLVMGGDSEGYGLERILLAGPNSQEPYHGGRWIVRFREGYESEAARLVREWDGKYTKIRGHWGIVKAELLW
ncbi:hypothetical protein H072_2457 [Dactylellina haptotyla CBS 200.50]|uniref:Uncharacterized protein n=1 Tax=Dactylellina haptotyla (strain CBS 200.50) TaxID=1284197 RepID=S8AL66_DACHA|nr:hypothetical protein H072_2457 [Dactylellina haptotyla CBS 200.50]